MRMYDYSEAFVQLESMLASGEIDRETYEDTVKSLEGGADEKAENVAKMIDNFKNHIASLKLEEDRLKAKRKTAENSISWLTNSLEVYLKATKKERHSVGLYQLSYRKLPDKVEFTDEKAIPSAYKVTEIITKIPKAPISKALKDGEEIPGVKLITDRTRFEVKK